MIAEHSSITMFIIAHYSREELNQLSPPFCLVCARLFPFIQDYLLLFGQTLPVFKENHCALFFVAYLYRVHGKKIGKKRTFASVPIFYNSRRYPCAKYCILCRRVLQWSCAETNISSFCIALVLSAIGYYNHAQSIPSVSLPGFLFHEQTLPALEP